MQILKQRAGLLCSLVVGLLSFACGQVPSNRSNSHTAAILGEDSLNPVDPANPLYSQISLQAIGRMQGGCTAFHLGQGLVATAGHCLSAPTGKLSDMPCASSSISWFDGNDKSRCLRYLAYRHDSEADFALIEVYPAPAASVTVGNPQWMETSFATVLGFPKDRELSASARCSIERSASSPMQFLHSCDTLPGNSGSPMFDLATGRLVGIHDGEANVRNYGTLISALGNIEEYKNALSKERLPLASDLLFGPFADQEDRLLATLESEHGHSALSFTLDIDLESGCDQLAVIDARGVRRVFTGKMQETLDLPSPISLVLTTDYAGTSQRVHLSRLKSH